MTLPAPRLALLLALGFVLPACTPVPTGERTAPTLDGVILSEGRPAAGVPLRLAVDVSPDAIGCPAGGPETVTDAQGHFSLPPPSSLVHARLFRDTGNAWRLCILRDDGGVWQDWHDYASGRLECELGRAGGHSRASEALLPVNGALTQRGCQVHPIDRASGAADGAKPPAETPKGMVQIPGGTFKMGKRGDTATVAAFWLDVTEVTADDYGACVRAGRCSAEGLQAFKADNAGDYAACVHAGRCAADGHQCGPQATYGVAGKGNHPINCVDANQATTYCASLGRRLPTEEEWEWAARGASRGTEYPWGNDAPAGQLCWGRWHDANNVEGTCAVGSFPSGDSPQGVKDLAGNVWEWTSSPGGPNTRVNRGGAWGNTNANDVRASNRGAISPSERLGDFGFRCARSF